MRPRLADFEDPAPGAPSAAGLLDPQPATADTPRPLGLLTPSASTRTR
jgi:hypothetical protein